jgi:hypothetical protein
MAFAPTNLRALYVATESSFSVDPDSDGSDYVMIPAMGISLSGDPQSFIAREIQRPTLTPFTGVAGAKGGQLTFSCEILGKSGGVMPSFLTKLFGACGLQRAAGGDNGVVVSATSTSVTHDGTGTWQVGSLIQIGSDVRMVTAESGNVLTISPAWSTTPSADDVVYAPDEFSLTYDPDPGTVSFVMKGFNTESTPAKTFEYTLTGCKGQVKISAAINTQLKAEFSFQIDSWEITSKASLPTSLPSNAAPVVLASPFYWGGVATPISDFAFDQGTSLTPRTSTSGAQGRSGFAITASVPSIAFKPFYADAWRSTFAAGSTNAAMMQIGTAEHRTVAIYAHKAQLNKYPIETDIGGLIGHDISATITDSLSSDYDHYVIAIF